MISIKNNINKEWYNVLHQEIQKKYFLKLTHFINKEYKNNIIYPEKQNIFNAFNLCSFKNIKVVILGQDPYHQIEQANGLAFSVKKNIKTPPSLKNIFKELSEDIKCNTPKKGDLSNWAKQGVLLLNSVLTVREKEAGSHKNKGWEIFTNNIISTISKEKKGIIFMLWGNYAKEKTSFIDDSKHYILTAAHPSPLSAYNGFFGCKHFSKTNLILKQQNKKTINWYL